MPAAIRRRSSATASATPRSARSPAVGVLPLHCGLLVPLGAKLANLCGGLGYCLSTDSRDQVVQSDRRNSFRTEIVLDNRSQPRHVGTGRRRLSTDTGSDEGLQRSLRLLGTPLPLIHL